MLPPYQRRVLAGTSFRWQSSLCRREAPGGLVPVPAVRAGKFHTAHKLTREAGTGGPASRHGPRALKRPVPWHYTEMGRLVADAGKRDWDELTAEYGAMLMEGLGVMGYSAATGAKQVNVLQHLMGFLKNHLSREDKAYLTVGLPAVGWSSWASSRKPGRGW